MNSTKISLNDTLMVKKEEKELKKSNFLENMEREARKKENKKKKILDKEKEKMEKIMKKKEEKALLMKCKLEVAHQALISKEERSLTLLKLKNVKSKDKAKKILGDDAALDLDEVFKEI